MLRLKTNFSLREILYWLFIIDMVWGGTGRVITVGPISFRILLMGLAVIYEFTNLCTHPIKGSNSSVHWLLVVFYFTLNLLYGILLGNNYSYAIDEYTGYITILLVPFFMICYKSDASLGRKTIAFFYRLIIAFALFSVALWFYAFITGVNNYVNIRRVLDSFVYGSVTYMGRIPRLFLKCSILLTAGLLISIRKMFEGKNKIRALFSFLLFVIAIITTFTTSFLVFSAALSILYFFSLQRMFSKNFSNSIITTILVCGLISVIINSTSVIDIMRERFAGDYTFQYKGNQVIQLLSFWLKRPMLGSGFGATVDLYSRFRNDINIYRFEVMWLQLLVHTGVIGFILFGSYILIVIRKCLVKKQRYSYLYTCGLFVIFVCLVSFTNPFMNNTIGLLPFSMIAGYVAIYM